MPILSVWNGEEMPENGKFPGVHTQSRVVDAVVRYAFLLAIFLSLYVLFQLSQSVNNCVQVIVQERFEEITDGAKLFTLSPVPEAV